MLDVHPPHHAAHSWRDFFIHIATITVGLLIAIGLEQTVEALHHRHQRRYLEEQMRAESERNLTLIESQIDFAGGMVHYLDACIQTLQTAPRSGGLLVVSLPPNDVAARLLVSPSRATWAVAKAAGTVALLPPEQAKVYARLDLAGDFEQGSESALFPAASLFKSSQLRDGIPEDSASTTRITPAQRDDLLFAAGQYRSALNNFQTRLAIQQGALEAVRHGVDSLDAMYPFQERALEPHIIHSVLK